MKSGINQKVAQILYTISDFLELQDVKFKPEAYRRAAEEIEFIEENIKEIYRKGGVEALNEIPGVGEHIAKKIEEIIRTGKLAYLEKLRREIKVNIEELRKIPSLGPKKIKILYNKLGIKNINDLERAIKRKKLCELAGFGEKTEQTLLRGIEALKTTRRFPYEEAVPIVERITNVLSVLPGVKKVTVAGSFRRKKSTVGDLDFIVVSTQPAQVMLALRSLPEVIDVIASGETKTSVRLKNGLQIDVRVVNGKQYGAALLYLTGSKNHGIQLRKLALKKGYTLNEYGLYTLKGRKWVAGRTEKEIYMKLGLKYLEPEEREI